MKGGAGGEVGPVVRLALEAHVLQHSAHTVHHKRDSQVKVHHRYQRHRWCTLSREYLREFSKKFEMTVMLYLGAWGKLIHEKNQKSTIS